MKKFLIALIFSFAFLLPAAAGPALAASANDNIFAACKDNPDGSICQDETVQNASGKNPVNNYIHIASNVVAALAGIAAVIIIIVSGFKFVAGGGSPENVKSARSTLIAAVVGLAIIALAWTIINFAVKKLIPN